MSTACRWLHIGTLGCIMHCSLVAYILCKSRWTHHAQSIYPLLDGDSCWPRLTKTSRCYMRRSNLQSRIIENQRRQALSVSCTNLTQRLVLAWAGVIWGHRRSSTACAAAARELSLWQASCTLVACSGMQPCPSRPPSTSEMSLLPKLPVSIICSR